MLIEPNGNSKSTLVCAISLGLGRSGKLRLSSREMRLGRAKEVSQFVKHGCLETEIEMELAGDREYPSIVIWCRITPEGNQIAFYFHGSPSSKKEILKVAQHFSIQIYHLCDFVGSDRSALILGTTFVTQQEDIKLLEPVSDQNRTNDQLSCLIG